MEPVDNPRIDGRVRSTPSDERSVRKDRSTWRSLDRNAAEGQLAREIFRISFRVEYRIPADVINYKTGETAVVLHRD